MSFRSSGWRPVETACTRTNADFFLDWANRRILWFGAIGLVEGASGKDSEQSVGVEGGMLILTSTQALLPLWERVIWEL